MTPHPLRRLVRRALPVALAAQMALAGAAVVAEEWWHYTYKPEPYPNTYFDFPVSRKFLTVTH